MSVSRRLSWGAGEISPEFYARVDQVRNQTGAKTIKNMTVTKSGAVQNRPGTVWKGTLFTPTATARLRQWIFNTEQTYLLEFFNQRLAFWRNGSPVKEAAKTITAATKASPCQLTTSGSHGYSVGDKVYISDVAGMTELNGRYYKVRTAPSGTTFTLSYSGDGVADGTAVDSTAFTTYTSGGSSERLYTITTPYLTADLDQLKFAQSAETMVIFHPDYAPRTLTRTAHTSWTLSVPTYGPSTVRPTGGAATAGAAGSLTFRYQVTAVDESTGIESLSGLAHTKTISAITKANPAVVTTSTNHGYSTGDEVELDVTGMTEVDGRRFRIELDSGTPLTKFKLVGEDSTSYGTFSAGSSYLTHINLGSALDGTAAAPNVITTNAAATSGVRYNVYRDLGGIFGLIGSTYALTFNDTGLPVDTFTSTPIYREPFQSSGQFPSCGAFYQQRLVMAGTDDIPNGGEASVTGDFFNFTIHSPSRDTDAVVFSTAGYVDRIRDMVALDKLVVFTSGAEFVIVGGGEGGALTPTEINARPRTYYGCGDLFPLLIDANILFVPERGQTVRDFYYSLKATAQDGYVSDDRMLWSRHLTQGHTLSDWAFQRTPDSSVWMVRDDGRLLSMTYLPDQELFGPTQHTFAAGVAENVCVVPETSGTTLEDVLYVVVVHTLEDGSESRYLERLANRDFSSIRDANFVDSSATYDGTGTGTVTITSTTYTSDVTSTLTFGTAQTWSASTVGDDIHVTGADGTSIRFRVTGFTDTTHLTAIPHTTVPVAMRSTALSTWYYAPDTITGLHHLEGKTVSILADGYAIASALNPSYETQYTVSDGAFTLVGDGRYSKLIIGLPITADLETLPMFNPAEDSRFTARTKLLTSVWLTVANTRGPYIGTQAPDDDSTDPIERLYEPKVRNLEGYNSPNDLFTGTVKQRTIGRWNRNGVVFIRQMEPVPCTITGISAAGFGYEG